MTPSTLKVISANQSFYQTFKVTAKETEGKFIYSIGNHQFDIPEFIYCVVKDILIINRNKINQITSSPT
jgi:hypothetical protein